MADSIELQSTLEWFEENSNLLILNVETKLE